MRERDSRSLLGLGGGGGGALERSLGIFSESYLEGEKVCVIYAEITKKL